jgi:hypothetical protein
MAKNYDAPSHDKKEMDGAFKYQCGSCARPSIDLSLFDAHGACNHCGSPSPVEFKFDADGRSFPESALLYYAADNKKAGIELAKKAKAAGIKVITREEIDLRLVSKQTDKNYIRDRLGAIFILPSAQLQQEDTAGIDFLWESNLEVPENKPMKAVMVLANEAQEKFVGYFQKNVKAIMLKGNPDNLKALTASGPNMVDRWLRYIKSERLDKPQS